MQSIQLKTHIGEDGLLQITMPPDFKNQDLEIMVIFQPLTTTDPQNKNSDNIIDSATNVFTENEKIFAHLRGKIKYFEDITTPTIEEWSEV